MRARLLPVVLALLAAISGLGRVYAADAVSTTFQVNPAHDGAITFSTAFAPALKQRWSVDFGGPVSYPVVAGNLAIVVADGPFGTHLAALNIATGKPLWQKLIDGVFSGRVGSPHLAYDAGRLFLITTTGVLQAFNPYNGKALWLTKLPGEVTFNYVPVAANGFVYAAGDATGGDIYQVSQKTGALVWTRQYSGLGAGLTLGGGNLYALMNNDVPALSLPDGKQIWKGRVNAVSSGIAAYYKNILYCPASGGATFAADTGKTTGRWIYGLPAFSGDLAFVTGGEGVAAVSTASHGVKWKFSANQKFSLPPITINGNVYALSRSGTLFVNDGGSGALLQKIEVGLGATKAPSMAPASGLGAGQGVLLVPSGSILAAFGP
jgi:outer membrane protein assembly factor BamB